MTEPNAYCWEHDQPLACCDHDAQPGVDIPWASGDGMRWLSFPAFAEWCGWTPGEDGLFWCSEAEFRRAYPNAPAV